MKRKLDVYLRQHLVGNLVQDEHGQMTFDYAETWLKNPKAIALSHSLPLTKTHFNRNECRGFFAGILPEESKREIVAHNLGISAKNDYAMLEKIGGECAGAVTFMPAGTELPKSEHNYRALTDKELAEILKALPRRPLMAGDEGVRLSLAGAQDKIAVQVSGNQISIPLRGAPSTHILKPALGSFEGVVANEALCMKLARAVGMNAAEAEARNVEGIDYLLVERYDRTMSSDTPNTLKTLKREHQEDFCQALGIIPENKYQAEGGPSLKQCFALAREASSAPVIDLQALLDAVIFNFLIGNHDAHGKNFSFLYSGGQTRLAPLYDLLSTSYYPELSPKMAMKIGGEYLSASITAKHFEQLAEEAGLAKPIVRRRVPELAELILSTMPAVTTNHPVVLAVAKLIRGNCDRTIQKFKM
ncbi:MAG TPA: type II toxin-antitoxin system HipA family toxin [Tepidisphaeraceae bacterium]|jgi:serine/threonine-protein kinase HipA